MEYISRLALNYPSSAIRDMFRLAASMDDLVNLCNGEPDFDTPQHIKDSAKRALDAGMTKYATEPGLLTMRSAVARKYTGQFQKPFDLDQVMISIGGVEGIFLCLAATMNPGDEVIVPDPAYTCYEGQILTLGGKPVRVPLFEENGFMLQPEDLEDAITDKTKAVILCYPSNPLGAVLKREDGEKLARIIKKHQILVISDEVYENIIFDGRKHFSMAQIDEIADQVLVVNSLSKTYAMTGWRLGYVVSSNRTIMQHMYTMQQAVASCIPTFIMQAGADALNGSQDCVEEMRREYERRRDLIYSGLCDIPGMKPFKSEGAFCIFVNIKAFHTDSHTFSMKLLQGARVMTIGGQAFGSQGEGYLRLCFANSEENISEGIRRIKAYLAKEYPDVK